MVLEKSQDIGEEAVKVFQEQFTENARTGDYHMLNHIPRLITEEENDHMTRVPESAEVSSCV